jgi:hypothetical protein
LNRPDCAKFAQFLHNYCGCCYSCFFLWLFMNG